MDRKISRPHNYISVGIVCQNWIQATTISYIGREEHSGKDIAQVSQIEDVVEILLEKKHSNIFEDSCDVYSYSGGVEDLGTANVNRNLKGENHQFIFLQNMEYFEIIYKNSLQTGHILM